MANVNAFTGGNGGEQRRLHLHRAQAARRAQGRARTEIINRLRPKMNRLPVASAFLQPAQDLRIGGRGSNALYQYTLQADNVADLANWGPILLANMKKLPGLQDVNTDQQNGGLRRDADLRPRHRGAPGPDRRSRSIQLSTTPSASRKCRSSTPS